MTDIARSSLTVSILSTLGLAMNFASNCVIADVFGAGREMDVFFAAATLPNFINGILCASLGFTFIPVLADYDVADSKGANEIVSSVLAGSLLASLFLCLILLPSAPAVMSLVAPGFSQAELNQGAQLLRWMLPLIVTTVANELVSSLYYAKGKFLLPSLAKLFNPLLVVFIVFFFRFVNDTRSIVFAMLIGSMLQGVSLGVGLLRMEGMSLGALPRLNHPGIVKILKLMLPLLLGLVVSRALPFIDRHFLSTLEKGSIAHVEYGFKLLNAIPPVVVSGIATAAFPVMARHASLKQWDELVQLINKAIRLLFFLSIPFVFLLAPFSQQVVALLFQRGAFTAADTVSVGRALTAYLLALPAMAIGSVIGQAFYVLQDTKTPAYIGVVEVAVYLASVYLLISRTGYLCVPLSFALYYNFSLINGAFLKRKIRTLRPIYPVKSLLSNVSAGFLAFGALYAGVTLMGATPLAAAVLIAAAFGLYFSLSRFLFGTEESLEIMLLIKGLFPAGRRGSP